MVFLFQRKVEFIKRTSKILNEKYNNDIPNSVNYLCGLPGEKVLSCQLYAPTLSCITPVMAIIY